MSVVSHAGREELDGAAGGTDPEKSLEEKKAQLPVTNDIAIEALCKEVLVHVSQ